MRQRLRAASLTIELIQPLCQRREDVVGGDAAGLDQLVHLLDRDAHPGRRCLQRAWQCLTQLPLELLSLDSAFAGHLGERHQGIRGLCAAPTGLAHGIGHGLEHIARGLTFYGRALGACRKPQVGAANLQHIAANPAGHDAHKLKFLRRLGGIASDGLEACLQRLHASSGSDHFTQREGCSHGCTRRPGRLAKHAHTLGRLLRLLAGLLHGRAHVAGAACGLVSGGCLHAQRLGLVFGSAQLRRMGLRERPDGCQLFASGSNSLLYGRCLCPLGTSK